MKPAKGKTWLSKLHSGMDFQVTRLEKAFSDIPEGAMMLIASPEIINDYILQIPEGVAVDVKTLRKDLALEFGAEYTCPLTTGIFIRIVAEANFELMEQGASPEDVAPFWRVITPKDKLARKLSFGAEFIEEQRRKEGLS